MLLLLQKAEKEVFLTEVFALIKVMFFMAFFILCVNKHLSHFLTQRPWVKVSALAMH